MMDKKPHIKPYLYGMFAGFGAISLSILFFFLIYRFQGFGNAVSTLTGILMPFIYGSVIAYLLKPVCNWIEAFLHKLFPERMHRFANMLAVALTILFGLLLIYALIMMIVPQLINSVTALYFTARDNIGDFVEWISKQEFIANNKKLLDFIEKVEYHSPDDTPVKLVFFADGEVYEVVYISPDKEAMLQHVLTTEDDSGRRLVIIEEEAQMQRLHIPHTAAYCMVDQSGCVQYFRKEEHSGESHPLTADREHFE